MSKLLFIFASLFVWSGVSSADSIHDFKNIVQEKFVEVSLNDAYFLGTPETEKPVNFIVTGLFPNSCYSFDNIDVQHATEFIHKVKLIARVKSGVCLMYLVPFTHESTLGVLSKGDHKVFFVAGDGTQFEKTVTIK
ncbi:MAG: hypothetical protein H6623_09740 [Bdellovibrionaceae bacterium]|nr:hypothetical protein [Pseudobdellovibrionaceae bacterium]